MPAHRKPAGSHSDPRGYAARQTPSRVLDAYGRTEPFPEPDRFGLDGDLADRYVGLWESATALVWIVSDAPLVAEYVRLRGLVDRLLVDGTEPKGTTLSRLGVIEDRLLLSPKSRHSAGLVVEGSEFDLDDEVEE